MKMLATSRPSWSRPPPFPRRSSTRPFAPCDSALSTCARSLSWEPWLNVDSETTPSFTPLSVTTRPAATGTWIFARLTVTVRGLTCPGDSTASVTLVPGLPLILSLAVWLAAPVIGWPLTFTIRSPLRMPARSPPASRRTR